MRLVLGWKKNRSLVSILVKSESLLTCVIGVKKKPRRLSATFILRGRKSLYAVEQSPRESADKERVFDRDATPNARARDCREGARARAHRDPITQEIMVKWLAARRGKGRVWRN